MLILKLIQQLIKTLNSDGTPGQVAFGMALGAALGLTPLMNLHNLLIVAFAMVLNVSMPGFFLGWALFIPLGFALDPAFDALGRALLLGTPALTAMWTAWYNTPVVPLSNFNNTVVLGSFVAWLASFIPLYFVLRWAVGRYRADVYERLKSTKVFRAIGASKVYNVYRLFRPE
ncbi:MAG: TIGR03546 family protein [Gemmatimonadetes bacterium]|nr:TIGR03546 family protein [Gemmatimonadota bacterium]